MRGIAYKNAESIKKEKKNVRVSHRINDAVKERKENEKYTGTTMVVLIMNNTTIMIYKAERKFLTVKGGVDSTITRSESYTRQQKESWKKNLNQYL